MTRKELKKWLEEHCTNMAIIYVCPRCKHVDVGIDHWEECNPGNEAYRQENLEHYN